MASGAKEGLSVYGLFHHLARTPQGKQLLRGYFLQPSLDIAVINERLDTASIFLRSDNNNSMNSIVKSLGHIKNMRTIMIHLRKGVSNGLSKGGGIKNGIWSSLRSVRHVVHSLRFEILLMSIEFAFYALQVRDALVAIVGIERLAIGAKVPLDMSIRFIHNTEDTTIGFRESRYPCCCYDW